MGSPKEFGFKEFVLYQWREDCQSVQRFLDTVAGDLTEAELNWQSQPGHHSMWHHIWHMFLVLDYSFSGAFGIRPVWEAGDWRSRIALSSMAKVFDQPGLGHEFIPRFAIMNVPDSLVDELSSPPLAQYLAYVDDMLAQCTSVLERASERELGREIVSGGRPTTVVRTAARFSHIYRHIGMMEDLRGLIRGPGQGTATH